MPGMRELSELAGPRKNGSTLLVSDRFTCPESYRGGKPPAGSGLRDAELTLGCDGGL